MRLYAMSLIPVPNPASDPIMIYVHPFDVAFAVYPVVEPPADHRESPYFPKMLKTPWSGRASSGDQSIPLPTLERNSVVAGFSRYRTPNPVPYRPPEQPTPSLPNHVAPPLLCQGLRAPCVNDVQNSMLKYWKKTTNADASCQISGGNNVTGRSE